MKSAIKVVMNHKETTKHTLLRDRPVDNFQEILLSSEGAEGKGDEYESQIWFLGFTKYEGHIAIGLWSDESVRSQWTLTLQLKDLSNSDVSNGRGRRCGLNNDDRRETEGEGELLWMYCTLLYCMYITVVSQNCASGLRAYIGHITTHTAVGWISNRWVRKCCIQYWNSNDR